MTCVNKYVPWKAETFHAYQFTGNSVFILKIIMYSVIIIYVQCYICIYFIVDHICDEGFKLVDGQCTRTGCPGDQKLVNGDCVKSTCPEGQRLEKGLCLFNKDAMSLDIGG